MPLNRLRLPQPLDYYEGQGLALAGRGAWRTARCAFHGGSDSMRVNVRSGSFCCMAGCGARGGDVLAYHMASYGLGFVQAAQQLGCWDEDPSEDASRAARRRPAGLPAHAALALLREDALVVAVAAGNLAQGHALSDADRRRLREGAARILRIAEAVGAGGSR